MACHDQSKPRGFPSSEPSKKSLPAILGGGRKRKSDSEEVRSSATEEVVMEETRIIKRVPLSAISSNHSPQSLKNSPLSRVVKPVFNDAAKENGVPSGTKKLRLRESWSEFRSFVINQPEDLTNRPQYTPFPTLSWVDKNDIWRLICKKESGMYERRSGEEILNRHVALRPRMRAILLDWLVEVCEVYRLHRETFYLAVDFLDRYLSVTTDMPKDRLQLIGVSCLFIGAKIEEIYPPKLHEFAYVTDGACTEDQILEMELVILKVLNWGLSPMTPNSWLKLFMQLSHCDRSPEAEQNFVLPQYSGLPFSRVMQLLDLCTMDMGFLSFKYSVLVASALYHFHNEKVALAASGYQWKDISTCVNWMSAFAFALREQSPLQPRSFHNVNVDNQHNIQSHTVELAMLDRAQARLSLLMTETNDRDSPDPADAPIHLAALELTPPEEEGDVKYQPERPSSATSTTTASNSSNSSNMFLSPPSQHGDAW